MQALAYQIFSRDLLVVRAVGISFLPPVSLWRECETAHQFPGELKTLDISSHGVGGKAEALAQFGKHRLQF